MYQAINLFQSTKLVKKSNITTNEFQLFDQLLLIHSELLHVEAITLTRTYTCNIIELGTIL